MNLEAQEIRSVLFIPLYQALEEASAYHKFSINICLMAQLQALLQIGTHSFYMGYLICDLKGRKQNFSIDAFPAYNLISISSKESNME